MEPTKRFRTTEWLESEPGLFDVVLSKMTTEDRTPPQVCQDMGLSWGAVIAWCNRDVERIEKFKAALEVRGHLLAEGALEVADRATVEDVQVAKLRVDTRKWLASRLNSKWFGEHQRVEHSGTVTNLMAVLSALPTRGGEIDVTPLPEKIADAIPEFSRLEVA